jgi:hypothetical protein
MERDALGSVSWTFPGGLVLAAATAFCWVLFALVSRSAVPSCLFLPRISWAFAAAGATGACLLPMSYIRSVLLRAICAVVAGAVAGALIFAATASLFPRFC